MTRLLKTSAMTLIALSTSAFAQDSDLTQVFDNDVTSSGSLLEQILASATEIQVYLLTASENLANLDGSINVLESANVDLLLQELTASVSFGGGEQLYTWELPDGTVSTGTQAEYEASIATQTVSWTISGETQDPSLNGTSYGTVAEFEADEALLSDGSASATSVVANLVEVNDGEDFVAGLLRGVSRTVDDTTAIDFFDPSLTVDALQTDVSNLTTTVIGALNTGVIGQNRRDANMVAASVLSLANMATESVAQTTVSLANSAQYFEPGDLQLANIANNMAEVVDASVTIDQLMANVSTVETTLIGSLNTGDIATEVMQNASNLITDIVGH